MPAAARTRAKLFDVRVDLGSIRGLRVFGNDFDPLIGFEIDEDRRSFHRRPNLLRVENMKQHHFIAVEAQSAQWCG